MGRLLGLDVGQKRTGLATTDELKLICSPLRTVDTAQLVSELKELHREQPIEAYVIGQPNLIVGQSADSTPYITQVIQQLGKSFPDIPIHSVDEGNTSHEASQIQRMGGMKKSKRIEKGSLDAITASLILQRFLDEQSFSTSPPPR